MTSEERHEARYRRRKAERQRRRDARSEACGSFEQVFSYEHLYRAGRECCKGVGWKCSTQRYLGNFTANIARTHRELMDGTWKTKGIDFAMDRLTCHMQRYYRKHGTDGWALVFDFSDYFNSAPHAPIYAESERRIRDERVQKLACGLMEDFGERGFGLGSQVSQIDALMLPNRLDHFIKEQLHIEGYGRYMDDGYLIHESRDYLQECLKQIRAVCADLGIRMNEKKTRIVKLQELHFLKTRFYLTETGKVRRKMCRKSARRMRRKLKTFRRWMAEGRMTEEDIHTAYESWRGHMRRGNSYRVLRRMDRFYKRLMEKGA